LATEHLGRTAQCPLCRAQFVAGRPKNSSAHSEGILPEVRPAPPAAISRQPDRPLLRRPSPPSRWPMRLVGGIVSLICLGILLNAMKEQAVVPPPAPLPAEDEEQRRQELREVFVEQRPLPKEEIVKQLEPLFTRLGNAFRTVNREQLVAQFDLERFHDEVRAMGLAPALTQGQRRDFLRGAKIGLGDSMVRQASLMQWDRFEIRNLKILPTNEAIATIRHFRHDGVPMRMRWWVSNRSGSWKIFDLEDLDIGTRLTSSGASLVQLGRAGAEQAANAFEHIQSALLAAYQQDPDEADRHMAKVKNTQLPEKIDAWSTASLRGHAGSSKKPLSSMTVPRGSIPTCPASICSRGLP
jgi:hypothetical protein